ncbi:MAG: radical SAM/CxCxxxxC motif protein YfkAB [Bacillus sp. (in: firmicutes)]
MKTKSTQKPIIISHDPWEAYNDIERFGKQKLTNIEFTTTNLCNMRCEHCAVGYTLTNKDAEALPIDMLLKRLDEVEHLTALSITGGEPMLSKKSVNGYVVPLLKYAHDRGVHTQMNSNLTIDLHRYEEVVPYLDVMHISHNWGTIDQFIDHGFAMMNPKPTRAQRAKLFEKMLDNSRALSKQGLYISAETMINNRTLPYLEDIHKQIVNEMLCSRHEIHPMYPSDFASSLEAVSLDEIRKALIRLMEFRNEDIWMLFGTLPFYACSNKQEDLDLLRKLYSAKNVTVRNDPDGRSRLNVNIFSGEIIVTDFGDAPPLGNVQSHTLQQAYDNWQQSPLAKSLSCHCPEVKCLGPNVLVKNAYYPRTDFLTQKANGSLTR